MRQQFGTILGVSGFTALALVFALREPNFVAFLPSAAVSWVVGRVVDVDGVSRSLDGGIMRPSNPFRLLTVLTAVIFTTTCTSVKPIPSEALVKEIGTGTETVVAYTTIDGQRHEFEGTVHLVKDELVFHSTRSPETPIEQPASADGSAGQPSAATARVEQTAATSSDLHLPLNEVASVEIRRANVWGTVGIVLLVTVIVVGLVAIIAAATFHPNINFCPFLYSFDGRRYVLDGEPYGGALTPSLARTDWSELDHLRAVDGHYQLLLTNEADETEHTDSLSLLVVDHPAEERAVMDYDGNLHLFRGVESPLEARDQDGKDLLPLVRAVDGLSWTPELTSLPERLPLDDTRDHLTVTFRRRPGSQRAWLLANVATGPWGSTQVQTLLGMRGTTLRDWLRALDGSPELQREIRAWDEREELFHLGVEVQVGGRWERRALLGGGGPLKSESRAVSLDLEGVDGDTVRLRLHPPITFWRFEAFELAWEERTVTPKVLAPRVARDERGRDVRPLLASDDGNTLDQPQLGAVTRITFDAPPLTAGGVRSIFAQTRGWYEVHLHGLGAPETANLARLEREPGYAVRRALDDFIEFRRSGRMPYAPPPGIAGAPLAASEGPP